MLCNSYDIYALTLWPNGPHVYAYIYIYIYISGKSQVPMLQKNLFYLGDTSVREKNYRITS